MPVLADTGSDRRKAHAAPDCVEIGLLNNMPDAALESTERQFTALLEAGAGDVPVRLRFFSLPGVQRGERAQRRLDASYCGIDDLWDAGLDALVVTGTEPRAAVLSDEPYWPQLTEVMDWSAHNTVSTIWSCLAAHAAVLHRDGIPRHLLPEKCIGVFGCMTVTYHPLTQGLPSPLAIPHSRHNELRESELAACGYEILTRSAQAGVDTFVKPGKSLSVFFQGRPGHGPAGLLGEYTAAISVTSCGASATVLPDRAARLFRRRDGRARLCARVSGRARWPSATRSCCRGFPWPTSSGR